MPTGTTPAGNCIGAACVEGATSVGGSEAADTPGAECFGFLSTLAFILCSAWCSWAPMGGSAAVLAGGAASLAPAAGSRGFRTSFGRPPEGSGCKAGPAGSACAAGSLRGFSTSFGRPPDGSGCKAAAAGAASVAGAEATAIVPSASTGAAAAAAAVVSLRGFSTRRGRPPAASGCRAAAGRAGAAVCARFAVGDVTTAVTVAAGCATTATGWPLLVSAARASAATAQAGRKRAAAPWVTVTVLVVVVFLQLEGDGAADDDRWWAERAHGGASCCARQPADPLGYLTGRLLAAVFSSSVRGTSLAALPDREPVSRPRSSSKTSLQFRTGW